MELDWKAVATLVVILVQTSIVSVWLGRLSQRVDWIKETLEEVRREMMRTSTFDAYRSEDVRRMGSLETRADRQKSKA